MHVSDDFDIHARAVNKGMDPFVAVSPDISVQLTRFANTIASTGASEKWQAVREKTIPDTTRCEVHNVWPCLSPASLAAVMRMQGVANWADALAGKLEIPTYSMNPYTQELDDGTVLTYFSSPALLTTAQALMVVRLPHLLAAADVDAWFPVIDAQAAALEDLALHISTIGPASDCLLSEAAQSIGSAGLAKRYAENSLVRYEHGPTVVIPQRPFATGLLLPCCDWTNL